MSREEILEKITQERKRRMREQAGRERLEREMLDMTQEDHIDLTNIMATVDKKDVPEEMAVIIRGDRPARLHSRVIAS